VIVSCILAPIWLDTYLPAGTLTAAPRGASGRLDPPRPNRAQIDRTQCDFKINQRAMRLARGRRGKGYRWLMEIIVTNSRRVNADFRERRGLKPEGVDITMTDERPVFRC
jgi:hypothetical protein